jgi:hypothetical protein
MSESLDTRSEVLQPAVILKWGYSIVSSELATPDIRTFPLSERQDRTDRNVPREAHTAAADVGISQSTEVCEVEMGR